MYNSQIIGNVGHLAFLFVFFLSCAFKASGGRIRVSKTITASVTASGAWNRTGDPCVACLRC